MRFLFRPDLGPTIGSGHAMRDLAIAEELVLRGHHVIFSCPVDGLSWVADAILSRGCSLVPPPSGSLVDLAVSLSADVVVIDSYTLPRDEYDAVSAARLGLASIVDKDHGLAIGDVVIDPSPMAPGESAAGLSGLEYALVRREFRAEAAPAGTEGEPVRMLVAFGGTDALGVAASMAGMLLALPVPLALTVMTRADLVDDVAAIPRRPDQSLDIVAPGPDFPALVRAHDAVVSASGSTSLELLAMGAAVGLVCVADNQERYYAALPAVGAALAIGTLDDVRQGDAGARDALLRLATDASLRATLRSAARATVDGRGPERVVDALVRLS